MDRRILSGTCGRVPKMELRREYRNVERMAATKRTDRVFSDSGGEWGAFIFPIRKYYQRAQHETGSKTLKQMEHQIKEKDKMFEKIYRASF